MITYFSLQVHFFSFFAWKYSKNIETERMYFHSSNGNTALFSDYGKFIRIQFTSWSVYRILFYNILNLSLGKALCIQEIDMRISSFCRNCISWLLILVLFCNSSLVLFFFSLQHPHLNWHKKKNCRRIFLKSLVKQMTEPQMEIRNQNPRLRRETRVSLELCGIKQTHDEQEIEEPPLKKRKRCHLCPTVKDRKSKMTCARFSVCSQHSKIICVDCDGQSEDWLLLFPFFFFFTKFCQDVS